MDFALTRDQWWVAEQAQIPVGDEAFTVTPWSTDYPDGRRLSLLILSLAAPETVPSALPGEGVEATLARMTRLYRYPESLMILCNPDQALGEQHMVHAQGCGLLAIDSPEREACWDAALAKGLPIYGVRDEIRCSCRRLSAASVFASLAFGNFTCRRGLPHLSITDDRRSVSWQGGPDGLSTTVIIREGFEAATIAGGSGRWADRGSEGVVRLRQVADDGQLWSQPRFIMPAAQGPVAGLTS